MIEIITGTLEEHIIKILQKTYPVTTNDLLGQLQVSESLLMRTLKKLQIKGIVAMEPLPDTTFLRLLRNDISFVGKKRQKRFIKHHKIRKQPPLFLDDHDDSSMYQ